MPEVLDNVCKTIYLVYVRMQGARFENEFENKNGTQRFCASAIGQLSFKFLGHTLTGMYD